MECDLKCSLVLQTQLQASEQFGDGGSAFGVQAYREYLPLVLINGRKLDGSSAIYISNGSLQIVLNRIESPRLIRELESVQQANLCLVSAEFELAPERGFFFKLRAGEQRQPKRGSQLCGEV